MAPAYAGLLAGRPSTAADALAISYAAADFAAALTVAVARTVEDAASGKLGSDRDLSVTPTPAALPAETEAAAVAVFGAGDAGVLPAWTHSLLVRFSPRLPIPSLPSAAQPSGGAGRFALTNVDVAECR